MSKINVKEIAESFFQELEQLYKDDIQKLVSDEVAKKETPLEQKLALVNGLASSLQNHTERFTIRLVQEVVDRLEE
ncbi:hypothetical protein D3C81_358420 [compost metagenome]